MFRLLIFTPLVLLFRQHYYAMVSIYLGLWAIFLVWAHYQFYGGRLWLVTLKTLFSLLLTQIVITILIMVFLRLFYK